jgi:hypothetical protein
MPLWFDILAIVVVIIAVLGLAVTLVGVAVDSYVALTTGLVITASSVVSFVLSACIIALVMVVTSA